MWFSFCEITISGEHSTIDSRALDAVVYGNLGVVTNEFLDECLVIPAIVTKTLTPVMDSRKRDTSLQLAYPLDGFSSVRVIEGRELLGLMVRGRLLNPPACDEFPLHLFAEVGGNDISERLDDVRHSAIRR